MLFTLQRVTGLVDALGFRADSDDPNFRLDSGETAAFARQLQAVETQIYEVEYPANRARDFIPVDGSHGAWAESFVWRIWDWAGMAKIITGYSDDRPAVDIMAAEKVQKIESLGDSFGYSIQDLRAASRLGMPLDSEKGQLARKAIENKIEDLSVLGDTATGLPGFVNMPNVPILSSPGDLTGNWLGGATPKQILADLHAMPNAVDDNTKGTHAANTIVLPRPQYRWIKSTTLNDYTSETILTTFLKQSDTIRQVDQWNRLDTADGSGGPLAVCYQKDPTVVKLVIPQEFEMLPPQPRNLAFKVPCHSRYGGVSWRYPLAAVYAVGL
jgi:hypothetical protein